jgi:hypothetical protein
MSYSTKINLRLCMNKGRDDIYISLHLLHYPTASTKFTDTANVRQDKKDKTLAASVAPINTTTGHLS